MKGQTEMKITQEFLLPEDEQEYINSWLGGKYKAIVEDYFDWLRHLEKRLDTHTITVDEARQKLIEIRDNYICTY